MKNFENELSAKLDEVENGNMYAIELFAELKKVKSLCEEAMKQVEDEAFIDAERNKGEVFNGYEVSTKDGSKRFNFKAIPDWVNLKEQLSIVEENSKQAWQMAQRGASYVTEDGEIIQAADVSYGKQSIVLTRK